MRRALVVTVVHPADDPRIRKRTIGSLAADFVVTYATPLPGPDDRSDIEWIGLRGGRLRRNVVAAGLMMAHRYSVVSIHDPELIFGALIARLLGRRIVFDLHENLPLQIEDKHWIPALLRPLVAGGSRLVLRIASRLLFVTLAEPGYRNLFRREHPVFPNYARAGTLPPLGQDRGFLVYVGDLTESRGALTMVRAAGLAQPRLPLVLVGRCPEDLKVAILEEAARSGVEATFRGYLPHDRAMRVAAEASVGLCLLHGAPNERLSLPTKVIEYLQMGVPVVATSLPGTAEAVSGLAGVELVTPGDAHAAAQGLRRALTTDRHIVAEQAMRLRRERVWPEAAVRRVYAAAAGAPGNSLGEAGSSH